MGEAVALKKFKEKADDAIATRAKESCEMELGARTLIISCNA